MKLEVHDCGKKVHLIMSHSEMSDLTETVRVAFAAEKLSVNLFGKRSHPETGLTYNRLHEARIGYAATVTKEEISEVASAYEAEKNN